MAQPWKLNLTRLETFAKDIMRRHLQTQPNSIGLYSGPVDEWILPARRSWGSKLVKDLSAHIDARTERCHRIGCANKGIHSSSKEMHEAPELSPRNTNGSQQRSGTGTQTTTDNISTNTLGEAQTRDERSDTRS